MELRKTLNDHPLITGIAALVIIVGGIWAAISFTGGPGSGGGAGTFYTTDNGATYSRMSTDEYPPFDSGGKEAVRAYVYTCGDGKEFVGYLEKYSPEAKQVLAQLKEAPKEGQRIDGSKIQQATTRGRLIKRPQDKDWVSSADMARALPIMQVKCPDGNPALPAE